jgi:hypothetical protein
MIIRDVLALSALALVLSAGPSYSGPCRQQIDDVRNAANAKRNALAEAGKSRGESTAATMHRQPTPKSVSQAEEQLGEISDKNAEAYFQAMDRAVAADEAGNLAECENALTEVRRVVDQAKR